MKKILFILTICWTFFGYLHAKELKHFTVPTNTKNNKNLAVHYYIPTNLDPLKTQLLVCFGGRNWLGAKTLKDYNFYDLADKKNLILVTFSFKNDDYWQPEKWSGNAMLKGIKIIKKKYKIKNAQKLLYFGYSAGGQCANLFYAWRPDLVEALALYGCGVWSKYKKTKTITPMLIMCGVKDYERLQLSYNYTYYARDLGAEIIFKEFTTGHEINKKILNLATTFFCSILENKKNILVGDDQTKQLYLLKEKSRIELDYRNCFRSKKMAKTWAME